MKLGGINVPKTIQLEGSGKPKLPLDPTSLKMLTALQKGCILQKSGNRWVWGCKTHIHDGHVDVRPLKRNGLVSKHGQKLLITKKGERVLLKKEKS